MWWNVHILCSLYIVDLYCRAYFRHNRVRPPLLTAGFTSPKPRERVDKVYSNIPCLFTPLPTRQRASQSRSYFVSLFCAASPGPECGKETSKGFNRHTDRTEIDPKMYTVRFVFCSAKLCGWDQIIFDLFASRSPE